MPRIAPAFPSVAVLVIAVSVFLAILLVLLYLEPRTASGQGLMSPFCCQEFAEELVLYSNVNVDPCTDFYEHTCYNWDRQHSRTYFAQRWQNLLERPLFEGQLERRPSVEYLIGFFVSCKEAALEWHLSVRNSILAFLGASNLKDNMTPTAILEFVLKLSFAYSLPVGVNITVERFTIPAERIHFTMFQVEGDYKKYWAIRAQELTVALEAFSGASGSRVTPEQVAKLMDDVWYTDERVESQADDVLGSLIPGVTALQWRDLIGELTILQIPVTLQHTPLPALKSWFSKFTDDHERPVVAAFLVVRAALDLRGSRSYRVYDSGIPLSDTSLGQCTNNTIGLRLLWDIAAVSVLTSRAKNEEVRAIYGNVKNVVVLQASAIFQESDMGEVSRKANHRRLVFGLDLLPEEGTLPNVSSNYWKNVLDYLDYELSCTRYMFQLGTLEPGATYNYGFQRGVSLTATERSVLVPAGLFLTLRLKNDTEVLVNLAVAGIQFAVLLWKDLLFFDGWASDTRERIDRYVGCQNEDFKTALNRAVLTKSLDSALRISQSSDWNSPFVLWNMPSMTRGRAFYMSYVLKLFCNDKGNAWVQILAGTLSKMANFRATFRCPREKRAVRCALE